MLGDWLRGYCRSAERNGARPRVVLVAMERSRLFPGIICQQIWKPQKWPQDWIRSAFILVSKKGNAKEHSNYHTIVLISHASKVMLRILQVRLQPYKNQELLDLQAGFSKGRGTRDQIANICWVMDKAREFQKNFCFIDCVDYNKLWKILRDREYQTTLPVS